MLRCGFAYSVETAASGICRVFLNAREDVEGGLGACGVPLGFQAHAHDPVEGEGQKADERVRTDTVWQPVVNRCDLDVGFQDTEATLDIGQRLVTRDGVSRCNLGDIGQQNELSIKQGRSGDGVFIYVPTEAIRRERDCAEFCALAW